MAKLKRQKRKPKLWIIIAAVIVIGAATAGVWFGFRVETIEYVGSKHYTEEELNLLIFDGRIKNTLLYSVFGKGESDIPFIQKYDVEIGWPNKMYITIYEKPVIGYVNYMGCNMYFDKDGVVVESSTATLSGIPQISGLSFKSIILNSKLEVGNEQIFARILDLTQSFDKYEIIADKIFFDSTGEVILYIGDVKVLLGECSDLTDKMYELKQIIPKLENLKGVLHMENFTKDTPSVIFNQDM